MYQAHGWLITVCREEMMNILTSVMNEQKIIWYVKSASHKTKVDIILLYFHPWYKVWKMFFVGQSLKVSYQTCRYFSTNFLVE